MQGDAGIRIPSTQWLQKIQEQCRETKTLFILDEIQCGMGRTGTTWAFEQFGVVPDVLCMGKALGGGMPIGGVACSGAAWPVRPCPFTWSHHHLRWPSHGCAGVVGAFEALAKIDPNGLERQLAKWEEALIGHNAVQCVRRIGAFIAVELKDACRPEGRECRPQTQQWPGVLLFWFLSVPNAFRLAPPLTCTDEDMSEGLTLIMDALDQAC